MRKREHSSPKKGSKKVSSQSPPPENSVGVQFELWPTRPGGKVGVDIGSRMCYLEVTGEARRPETDDR